MDYRIENFTALNGCKKLLDDTNEFYITTLHEISSKEILSSSEEEELERLLYKVSTKLTDLCQEFINNNT